MNIMEAKLREALLSRQLSTVRWKRAVVQRRAGFAAKRGLRGEVLDLPNKSGWVWVAWGESDRDVRLANVSNLDVIESGIA